MLSVSKSLWFKDYDVHVIQDMRCANMVEYLGMELLEIGSDYLKGRMPVDHRTIQPFGILHGGASCVLSETLGSVGAWMTIDPDKYRAVGVEINANHIRAVTGGWVVGICTPLHVGKRTQVWQTDMVEEATGKRTAISRLTVAIIDHGSLSAQKDKIVVG
jgi:1,4-dihydroxy-2-naphthoyl-CoA hydrolase